MKLWKTYWMLMVAFLLILLAACGGETEDAVENQNNEEANASENTEEDSEGEQQADELETIRVALSPFQDVYSIHVGVEQGFFEEAGIELDIVETDWAGGNDLLVGGQVDVATAGDSDVVLQNSNGVETTLAFPIFYFAGAGLMYDSDKHDWKTYDQLLDEGNEQQDAMRMALEQVKGMKVGLNTSVSEYTSFISMLDYVGLDSEDNEIVDMSQEDLPPALLSGSIDVMISGIPQRLAVQKEGYATLIDQTTLPYTISHNGFAAHRPWIEENRELSVHFIEAIFKTFKYIEENPDDSFPIIVDRMKDVGTEITVEELKSVWNEMEYFPSSKDFYQNEVLDEDGDFYWQERFERVVGIMEAEGRIDEGAITDLESLHYTVDLIEDVEE